MASSYTRKNALSLISFNPAAFRAGRETFAGIRTYNRVEDKG